MSKDSFYLYDPESEQIFEIKKLMTVGRSDSNDLPIKDQSISSKHARLTVKGGSVYVMDLDSFNSTYINANECKPEVPYKLNTADVLQFGDKVFYYNSVEANSEYLALPSMTGSFQTEKTGHAIVRDYYDPILEAKKQKKAIGIKYLRQHKEEIEKLHENLAQVQEEIKASKNFKKHLEKKNKELSEFDSYLSSKKYSEEAEVNAIIFSIEEVSERIKSDKEALQEKIDILKNQLAELEDEMAGLDQEKDNNAAMVSALNTDIEIIKARNALILEIEKIKKDAESFNEEKYQKKIEEIKDQIQVKERQYKAAQEKYANSRFGKKGNLFGKKAS